MINLDECKTVKKVLLWAEQEWPGFWAFANQKDMTMTEILELYAALNENGSKAKQFTAKLLEVGRKDKSEEARNLLMKGAGSVIRLHNQVEAHRARS